VSQGGEESDSLIQFWLFIGLVQVFASAAIRLKKSCSFGIVGSIPAARTWALFCGVMARIIQVKEPSNRAWEETNCPQIKLIDQCSADFSLSEHAFADAASAFHAKR
jgi:hypothetical protein